MYSSPLPHRFFDRFSYLSWLLRFLGGEWLTVPRARKPCLYGWALCFFRLSSFWFWLFSGSLASSFCSWSCSLLDGSVFLIVLMRNLLLVLARGHFIQPIGPIVSALVFPRFASLSSSSIAFLSSSWSSSMAGAASGILRWCWRTGRSSPYRETCERSRKEGTADGKSGRRKEGGGAAAAPQGPSTGRGLEAQPRIPAHRPRPISAFLCDLFPPDFPR